ncbi:MAG: phage baseplate assembly protein V [Proteobacteria bacterium]|nr:phage baseplate assembly protein V [Pseudomonadota bacterium]MBU1640077.1 phage baseplate assembly protein V [Pseudomonadota bacterium]
MSESTEYRLAELERRLNNLLRMGTIAEADYPAARVKVASGDLLTGWIPWLTRRAGNDSDWWAPEVGEQVLLLSPAGDPAQALCLPSVYQQAHPARATLETVRRIDFADGGFVQYDRASGELIINVVGDANITVGGKTTLVSAATVEIDGGSGQLNGTVQGDCLCAFTGKPHPHVSPTVKESF